MTMSYRKLIITAYMIIALLPAQVNADKRKFQIDVLVFSQDLASTEDVDSSPLTINWPGRLIKPGQKSTEKINTSSSSLLEAEVLLNRKPQYSILKHISWTQTIPAESAGKAVRIQGNGVNGFVQLKRGHNLHLKVGMEYQEPSTGYTYTLSEQRRILFNQKHYFDHPRFGIIISVSPL